MRILQLCQKPPYPAVDGGCIAMHQISQLLVELNHEVHVLAMETYKHPLIQSDDSKEWMNKTNQQTVFVDIKVNPLTALSNLFSSKSYNVERFNDSAFETKLRELLKQYKFDVVVFDSLYTTTYLETVKSFPGIKTIYRAHNIEQYIWNHHVDHQRNPILKEYFKILRNRLKKYEDEHFDAFDAILSISDQEREIIRQKSPNSYTKTLSIFWKTQPTELSKNKSISFFHIGSMDWKPNQDGIQWFLDDVWEQITMINPKYELHLAGRSMPDWLLKTKRKNLFIHGEVERAEEFVAQHNVMVVPLFSASGVRIKIIEAMAQGKVVICTSVAAQGINYTNNRDIIIADTAEEFVQAIKLINSGQSDIEKIGEAAIEVINKSHNKDSAGKQLSEVIEHITTKNE